MESNEHKLSNESNESMNSNELIDHKDSMDSSELIDHKELKESNLELLIKIIDRDKYYKRKREDKFEESNITNFLIDSDEESEIELETKGTLLDKDIFNTFNVDYETYLRSNRDLESEILFDHPLFSSYKLKNVTPLVKYLLSLREVPNPITNHSEYHINTLISKRINILLKSKKIDIPQLSSSIKYFFTCLNTYVDVFYLNNRIGTLDSIRFIYSLHIANHITKSSSTKSSTKSSSTKSSLNKSSLNKSSLNKSSLNKSSLNKSSRNEESDVDERTEGFTRPKVLVICGLRCIAKDIITNLLKIIPTSKSNKNLERFEMEFSLSDEDLKEQNESYLKTKKAKDYVMTFSGNQDDAFKIGILYESGLLNLYTPFYSSDIIIASPLGLRPLINEPDYDFLSSIEILLIDRIDIIKFQNWKLFLDLFNVINRPLLKWRDGDINKIRMSIIDGQIEEYRQNIIISSSRSVIFNSFFKNLKNKRGSIRLFIPNNFNYIQLASKFNIQQLFIKVPSNNIKNSHTDTIKYFMENMLPNLEDINGILIILSDYTQYFSISKKLKGTNVQYLTCLESNTPKQMKFARQQFQSKNIPILITTIRLLFFKRYLFKGTSKIFLLEPPEYVQIYKDLIRMLDENRNNTIICYYTNYHAIVLEPIVGSNNISKLINAPNTKITQFN